MQLRKHHLNKGIAVVWEDHWEGYDAATAEELSKDSELYIGIARGTLVSYDRETIIIASNYWPKDKIYDGSIFRIARKLIKHMEMTKDSCDKYINKQ